MPSIAPRSTYQEGLDRGELLFQRDGRGRMVFPPRITAPLGCEPPLTWHQSTGAGTVYAVTGIPQPNGASRHLILVDLDEGFRILSEILGDDCVEVGDRVAVSVRAGPSCAATPYFTMMSGR